MSEMVLSLNNYDCLENLVYEIKKQKKMIDFVIEDLLRDTQITDDKSILCDFLKLASGDIENCYCTLNTTLKCVDEGKEIEF